MVLDWATPAAAGAIADSVSAVVMPCCVPSATLVTMPPTADHRNVPTDASDRVAAR